MKKQKLIPAITVFAFVAFCFAIAHSFGQTYALTECPTDWQRGTEDNCYKITNLNPEQINECEKLITDLGRPIIDKVNYCIEAANNVLVPIINLGTPLTSCPDGWTSVGNICYGTAKKTESECSDQIQGIGLNLNEGVNGCEIESDGDNTVYLPYITINSEENTTTYSATFNVNGGIWKDGHTNQTRTISYTDKLEFTDARLEVEKSGFYWCGWTRSDGKTLGKYVDSNENGQTLTAEWCENSTPGGDTQEKILIYFVKADNTVADTKTINKNETLVMPENVSTKTGYTFNGWEDLSLNDGTIYKIGEEISFEEDAILRESWTENPDDEENETTNKVTIIYDENGGTIKKDDSSLNYCEYSKDETSCAIKKLPTATREEYTFKGWGETNTCTEGYTTEIPNLTLDENGKTYYACWIKNASVDDENNTPGEDDNNTPEKPNDDDEGIENVGTGSTLLYLVYLAGILSLCYTVVYSYRYLKARK